MKHCTNKCIPLCYDSCRVLNKCNKCNYGTCYDDILFINKLLDHIEDNINTDKNNYFVSGASNGGIMS